MSLFGDALRRHRRHKGYTVRGLADSMGIASSTISNVENGRRAVPPSFDLQLCCKVLGLADAERETFIELAHSEMPGDPLIDGCYLIRQERTEQILGHGHVPSDDKRYTRGELVLAAMAYIKNDIKLWPWDPDTFKPGKKNLVKAGALLAAEIDRTLRK